MHLPRRHPLWRNSLTTEAAANPARLERIIMSQVAGPITNLCPKAQASYGHVVCMGLLFAQGGVRMHRNGILMVKTEGYAGR